MQKALKALKLKACTVCKTNFAPWTSTQRVCGRFCAQHFAKVEAQKKFDAETRRMKKVRLDQDASHWSENAQKACHEYIKYRDAGKPCISCGNIKITVKYDAGHFIPRGRSAALRFELTNIHRQCSMNCNNRNSGNCIEYRKALVKKYGAAHVEWLEGPHELPRYRLEDYKRIYAEFKVMTKQLKQGIA